MKIRLDEVEGTHTHVIVVLINTEISESILTRLSPPARALASDRKGIGTGRGGGRGAPPPNNLRGGGGGGGGWPTYPSLHMEEDWLRLSSGQWAHRLLGHGNL